MSRFREYIKVYRETKKKVEDNSGAKFTLTEADLNRKITIIWVFMHCLSELAVSLTEIRRAAPAASWGEVKRGPTSWVSVINAVYDKVCCSQ